MPDAPPDNSIEIRTETPDDHAAVFDINRSAFGQDNEARLVEALRRGDAFIPNLSLVAVLAERIVGHILFTHVTIEASGRSTPSLALAPMAVTPERQRRGIGSALVREGLATCRRLGHTSVIVLGHPAFYPRFGFVPAMPRGIRPPFDAPAEAFLAHELVPGSLDGVEGVVRYAAGFEDV
ncbi:MAG: N-acetyltransferase [Phycisphaerae bacterium]